MPGEPLERAADGRQIVPVGSFECAYDAIDPLRAALIEAGNPLADEDQPAFAILFGDSDGYQPRPDGWVTYLRDRIRPADWDRLQTLFVIPATITYTGGIRDQQNMVEILGGVRTTTF